MTVSTSTLGLLYGAAPPASAAAASMNDALMASVTYGEAGLSSAPLETQLLDLSFADPSGTTMFDVVGAYYGASAGMTEMLAAYADALQTAPGGTGSD